MELIINNKKISASVQDIVYELREATGNHLFSEMKNKGDNLQVTCPIHKGGHENKPSCSIYTSEDGETMKGWVHCFTCGYNVPLYKMVADCFNQPEQFGKDWLVDRFSDTVVKDVFIFPSFEEKPKETFLDESILDKYKHHTNYWATRQISDEVVEELGMGYDIENDMIVFPVRDHLGRLVMLTKRSIKTKFFHIDANKEKPVFLLYDLIRKHTDTAYVVESQINALTLRTWGYPSIALIGTGSSYQYKILKKSGIRNYILVFDGDTAGDKGAKRFIEAMPPTVFISKINVPRGKDVNDLTKEEFEKIPIETV